MRAERNSSFKNFGGESACGIFKCAVCGLGGLLKPALYLAFVVASATWNYYKSLG